MSALSAPAALSASHRWRTRALRLLEFPLALAVVVALWQIASVTIANKTLLPSPLRVLLAWVEEYYTRDDQWSLRCHRRLFEAYTGKKTELIGLPVES